MICDACNAWSFKEFNAYGNITRREWIRIVEPVPIICLPDTVGEFFLNEPIYRLSDKVFGKARRSPPE